ncbi:phosphatase PAP2 family protein [Catenuloplanes indicus]|uniref:Phosphatidic acid phosphatase type 2/haloperoxidase domain-containing protein n=1 Tax=Catenuloplanes indicus TaxID=137267 RepID=A0AAE4AZ62_9ACTN|nr:phosphatase PAP2 family protein [Catenuloplanes indicus]MDQ0368117.1 hypothetical protein [Catenuloplanes indicus]
MRRLGWWFDVLLLAAFAALTALLAAGHLYGVDSAIANYADAHRPPVMYWLALIGNQLGQSGHFLIAFGVIALWLLYRDRDVRPLILVAFTYVLAGVVVVPLKEFGGRDAPSSTLPNKVELFNDAAVYDWSYPSGHMVNTFVWFFTMVLLLTWLFGERARRFEPVIRIAPPVIVFVTTIYLSFHWLTDSIAGLLIGVVLRRVMARIPWRTLPLPAWLPFTAAPVEPAPWSRSPWRARSAGRSRSAGAGGAQSAEAADQDRIVR